MGRIEENKELVENLLSDSITIGDVSAKEAKVYSMKFILIALLDISKSLAILADRAERGDNE